MSAMHGALQNAPFPLFIVSQYSIETQTDETQSPPFSVPATLDADLGRGLGIPPSLGQ